MSPKTLSDLKDSSEGLVEVNEKNKNNVRTAQSKLSFCSSQAAQDEQIYFQATAKYNQAVQARNALASQPPREGDNPENIAGEINKLNQLVYAAENELQSAANQYKLSLYRQKQATYEYQKAQTDLQNSTSQLNGIKKELGSKINDYSTTFGQTVSLMSLDKSENIQPFIQHLKYKRYEATAALNKVLRSLGEAEIPFDDGSIPGDSDSDRQKIKTIGRWPGVHSKMLASSESKNAFSQYRDNLNLNSDTFDSNSYNQQLNSDGDSDEKNNNQQTISNSFEKWLSKNNSDAESQNDEAFQKNTSEIYDRFSKIKSKSFSALTKAEQQELVSIAVDNLKQKYGGKIPDSRFEKIKNSIHFVDCNTVAQELNISVYKANYYLGYYSPRNDEIKINISADDNIDSILATLDHESLHMLTANWYGFYYSTGVKTNSPLIPLGNVGMNEGLTELYSIRNMKELYPTYVSNSYTDNVEIMEKFETVFGADALKKSYMENDFPYIQKVYDSFMGTDSFEYFCNSMDEMHTCYEENKIFEGDAKKKELEQLIDTFNRNKRGI